METRAVADFLSGREVGCGRVKKVLHRVCWSDGKWRSVGVCGGAFLHASKRIFNNN